MPQPRNRQVLLIDGTKYNLWVPQSEDELEKAIKEHYKEIFGNDSVYLDLKQKLRSKAGIGSIPDGYVLTFEDTPRWCVIEVELSSHPLYDHIAVQVTKFINGIENPYSQREIVNLMDGEISKDEVLKARIRSKIGPEEIHRFLSNLVSNPPVIVIIIDEKTNELQEVCNSLLGEKKIVEFKTFAREGVDLMVHAHIYDTLIKPVIVPSVIQGPLQQLPSSLPTEREIEVIIRNGSFIKFHLFVIPKGKRRFFPGYKVPFKLDTDIGEIETYVISAPRDTRVGDLDAGTYIQASLAEWYRRHPNIKVGDKVVFVAIEPMRRYSLTIP